LRKANPSDSPYLDEAAGLIFSPGGYSSVDDHLRHMTKDQFHFDVVSTKS
jgi:hypothetical protein